MIRFSDEVEHVSQTVLPTHLQVSHPSN